MKKFGFTLAEVLITLSIIGVIAALTTPALVNNGKNEANGAKLAVTVSNLENAFQNAMVKEGAEDIYQTSMWEIAPLNTGIEDKTKITKFIGNLGQYMAINGYKDNIDAIYPNRFYRMSKSGGKGTKDTSSTLFNGIPIMMKNGAVVIISLFDHKLAIEPSEAIERGIAMTSDAAAVYIDVNGADKPNIIGRDLFLFHLGQNGILYPVGGRDTTAFFDKDNVGKDWTNYDKYSCPPTEDTLEGGDGPSGWGCTARLVEENYKMNY